ncbi:MAG: hypothetical protein J5I90_04465 [Caldilineales bacterium]|nr:hypothetical protein [Caldilineales bacterium]
MRAIDQLAALQHLDAGLDADRRRYAEIQAALHEPEELQTARAERNEISRRLEDWRGERRQRETAAADQQTRVRETEKLLYSGKVRDAREQVALQNNVEALKRHQAALEEAALEAMLEQEQAESDLAEAEEKLGKLQAAWDRDKAELESDRQAVIGHARSLKAQRDTAASQIDKPLLQRYEALREKTGGVAVAAVQGANCGGCGAALPTAVRQQTHGDELITCPICRRLLVG